MRTSAATRPRGDVIGVSVLVLSLLGASATPAFGHASGELPTAEVRAEGSRIHVQLVAPPDDAAVIGTVLGYLGDGAMQALLGGPADDLPTEAEIDAFSRSAELRDYLVEHVSIRQGDVPCTGEAEPAADFLIDGARLTFTCPEPVVEALIRITVLHDVDPAYRTFTVDGTEQYAIHSAAAPEHTWDFTRTGTTGIDPVLVIGLAVLGLALVVAVLVIRPRRRRGARR